MALLVDGYYRQFSNQYDFIIFKSNKDTKEFSLNNKKFKYRVPNGTQKSWNELLAGVDAVIHLAAIRTTKNRDAESFLRYIPNIELATLVFNSCSYNRIRNIINVSTIGVYQKSLPEAAKEPQVDMISTLYGLSKYMVENLATYMNYHKKLNIKSLRLAQVIGWGERPDFMLSNFITKSINKEKLFVWGQGKGRREYIYIKDVVDAIITALNHSDQKGIYNIGTGVNTSHRELAEVIANVFDNLENIKFLEDKVEDSSTFLMNIEKAKNELGWDSKIFFKKCTL